MTDHATMPPMSQQTRDDSEAGQAWDAARLSAPHVQPDKADRVRRMFDAIAPTYELVNRLGSAGRDACWRRDMVRLASVRADDVLLDVACGTGDVARAFAAGPVRPSRIVGVDFSERMLAIAARRPINRGLFVCGDALRLPVADGSASLVTCAFGIRNFQDLSAGWREMHRVLCDGGRAVVLEFSIPETPILRRLYLFYFRRILPLAAALVSRDRSGAYRYLPQSVLSFAGENTIRSTLMSAGFSDVTVHRRSGGIVALYVAVRR
ncbi:MAG TPA: ubiquinone/menaquinone biosynthesis methyltransferase [Phycisphaerae bacterium]|nr:ubiquinone/menaquinone biosynthesis methyltransferase [Phycisphaerae bacterium]